MKIACFGHCNCSHYVEPQKRKVREIVCCEGFVVEMGVYASEPSQTARSDSIITGVRNHYFLMISHNNVGYPTLTIYKKAYLTTNFMGQLTDIASEFE